ncbi:LytR/AlgR family response regulator transcription factor [Flagellimonas myxillae]|uniref:LytR/AlgR family response regulator transcription factor n=1 Tax=Flagellimonas myxillae TaxID=2942214 RepID=UPI00201EF5E5|nr:response regulator transcription factor [Muricauda myxillae]MCL6266935.1 response regulator transcription factor [Muricauda myxillae]
MNLRCVIIDDEYLARQRILKLLQTHTDVAVVGECRNGSEAIEKIRIKEPDFVFLDIQMPNLSGFEILERLKKVPYVIFTTAFDAYAVKAFEINAVDYLLKPFDQERLDAALDRMRSVKQNDQALELGKKLSNLFSGLENNKAPGDFRTGFEIKKNGRLLTVKTEDLVFIKSEGNYLELHTEKDMNLFRATLNSVETELSPLEFIRIHRSLIISKRYLEECYYLGNSYYRIRLKTGLEFRSGRLYKERIVSILHERG